MQHKISHTSLCKISIKIHRYNEHIKRCAQLNESIKAILISIFTSFSSYINFLTYTSSLQQLLARTHHHLCVKVCLFYESRVAHTGYTNVFSYFLC